MAKYKTLKRSAGRHNFLEDKQMDFPADEAKLLLADGAIAEIASKKPTAKSETTTKKQADSKGG